tara:strand:- start:886 stop:1161 length:276 start_codon:yes stop_codon:yes gene_type:complete
MSKYHCPFCSSRYQFHKTKSDGVLICGLCGEPLVRKPLIKFRRIVGVIAASGFLAPLLIMIVSVVNDFPTQKLPKNSESLVLVRINKSWKI